jgi:hypothetical protein
MNYTKIIILKKNFDLKNVFNYSFILLNFINNY